jgi:hypothetical protein
MSASENNQFDNYEGVVQDNSKKKRGGSQKKSWVWNWFISDEKESICQVEIVTGQYCGRRYKNGSSTGNLISHLNNKHQITEAMKKDNYVVRKFSI